VVPVRTARRGAAVFGAAIGGSEQGFGETAARTGSGRRRGGAVQSRYLEFRTLCGPCGSKRFCTEWARAGYYKI
jgi:hypothetical protein